MIRYILKRILWMIPILIGVTLLVFSILYFSPGDPARTILGEGASEKDIQVLREQLGLNKSFIERYADFLFNAVKGDFGTSYQNGTDISPELLKRFPNTFTIAIGGLAIAILIGIPLGILSAVKQYSFLDSAVLFIGLVISSLPAFFVAILFVLIFALQLGWFPAIGTSGFKSFILPCTSISLGAIASLMRLTRSSMLEVIKADYVRTARAKGAGEVRIMFYHCLQNALMPVITTIGSSLTGMMATAVVIEQVFSIEGMGSFLVNGVRAKDAPVVLGCVTFLAIIGAISNLFVDILYGYVDPRIKSLYRR